MKLGLDDITSLLQYKCSDTSLHDIHFIRQVGNVSKTNFNGNI